MDSERCHVSAAVLMMGHAFNRPFCIRCQQEMSLILLQRGTGQVLSRRHIPDGLFPRSPLRSSLSASHPEGNYLSPTGQGQCDLDSPLLAPPAMVHSPSLDVVGHALPSSLPRSPLARPWLHSSPRRCLSQSCSLEDTPDIMNVLL